METFEHLVERAVAECKAQHMIFEEGVEYIFREIAKKLDADGALTRGQSVDNEPEPREMTGFPRP